MKTLGELAQVLSGSTPSRDNIDFWQDGSIPWVTPTDITGTQSRVLTSTAEKITPLGLASCAARLLPIGSLLMTSRATLGEIKIAGTEVCTNQGFKSLVPRSHVDNWYLYYQMQMNKARYSLLGKGSTFLEVNKIDTESFEIPCTSLTEQRKIARILTTVDNLIEKTESLIAKYESIKQGMMHDLFTRGVDAHGQLRPPYAQAPELYKHSELGWIPNEWEVQELFDLVEFWDGRRIPLKQEVRDSMDGEFPYYGASGVIDYVDRYIFDDELILLGEDGENVVSRNLPLAFRVSGKCWVNNHAHVLKPLSHVDIDFLTEYLESLDFSCIASGSAQPKITQKHLAKTKVLLPKLNEQQEITRRLRALKVKLESEHKLARKLRLQKTGLMQDLLTGKVRVTFDGENTDE